MPHFLDKFQPVDFSYIKFQIFLPAIIFFICLNNAQAQTSSKDFSIAPAASTININGQVLLSSGRGVSRALVYMTDRNGESRIAMTNYLGFYNFKEVPSGETYIFNISSKRYTFDTRVVAVMEDLEKLDFTASP